MDCLIHKGKVCRITQVVERQPDRVKVQIVTGERVQRSRSGSSPGPGWRPDPNGEKRRWVKHTPQYDVVTVMLDEVLEEWPVGWEKAGKDLAELVVEVKPIMQMAINAGGTRARRVLPEIPYETFEAHFRAKGSVIPSRDEITDVSEDAWNEARGRGRGRERKSSRGVIVAASERPEFGDIAPEGTEVPAKHFYSETFGTVLKDTPTNRMKYHAGLRGWPFEGLEKATKMKKGVLGITLSYAVKNDYDADKFGATRTEGAEDEGKSKTEETPPPMTGELPGIEPGSPSPEVTATEDSSSPASDLETTDSEADESPEPVEPPPVIETPEPSITAPDDLSEIDPEDVDPVD